MVIICDCIVCVLQVYACVMDSYDYDHALNVTLPAMLAKYGNNVYLYIANNGSDDRHDCAVCTGSCPST